MNQVECVAPTCCVLGLGAVWSPSEGYLWWLDSKRAKLHRYNPRTTNTRRYDLPLHATAMALNKGSLLMLGDRETGLYDPETEAYECQLSLESEPEGNRTNVGTVAPDGGLWFTTMDKQEEELSGHFYRLDPTGTLEKTGLDPVRMPGGLSFSPDGRIFYLSDTANQEILAFDHDPDTGVLTERRVFASTETAGCYPQGTAIDCHGCLWTAHWTGSRIVRYTPDGAIDRIIDLPVSRPTGCVFGGPNLKRLFITSARAGLSDQALDRQPMAGCLFAIDVEVPGTAVPEWGHPQAN